MTDTEPKEPRTIGALLAEAARQIGPIGKDDQNEGQGFAYRGMERVLAKVQPVFSELGIVVIPTVLNREVESILTGNGKPWRLVALTIRYRFLGIEAEDYLDAVTVGEGFDPSDKAGNKAMTNAFKYALLQVLGINDGDLRESDAESQPEIATLRPRRARSRKPQEEQPTTPNRAQRLAKLSRDHGGQHAAAIAAMLSAIDSIPLDTERADVRELFTAHFDHDAYHLTPDQVPEAREWVERMVAAAKEPKEAQ